MTRAKSSVLWESKLLHKTLVLLSIVLILVHTSKLYEVWLHPDPRLDLHIYWKAGREALNGGPKYHHYGTYGPHMMPGYFFYSPVFAAAVSPISRLSFMWFVRVWYIVIGCAFCVFAWSIARLSAKQVSPAALIITLAALFVFGPNAYEAFGIGQADIIIWALFGLTLVRGSSSWLTATLFMKPHPVWALAVFCRRSGKRSVIAALTVGIAGILLGLIVCGPASFVDWLSNITPLSQGTFYRLNYSPSMGVLRLLRWTGVWQYSHGPLPTAARVYLAAVAFIGPMLTIWLTRYRSIRFQTACVGAAAVICSPLCWIYYFNILFLPAAVWWGERRIKRQTAFDPDLA